MPISQELICFNGNSRTNCVWRHGALKVESKIIRGIEEIRPELAGLMTHAQFPNKGAPAVPRKIRAEFRERHLLIRELPKRSVPDDVRPKSARIEIYRASDFEKRRRMKFDAFERFPNPESIKECFEKNKIQAGLPGRVFVTTQTTSSN